jgi:hypothetical protein
MVNSIINSQEIDIFHCNINTCHNTNIKVDNNYITEIFYLIT